MSSKDGVELGDIAQEHIAEAHSAVVTDLDVIGEKDVGKVTVETTKEAPTAMSLTDAAKEAVAEKSLPELADAINENLAEAKEEQAKSDALKVEFARKAEEAKAEAETEDQKEAIDELIDEVDAIGGVDGIPRDMGFVADDSDAMDVELSGLFNTFRIGDRWADVAYTEELYLWAYTIEGPMELKGPAIVLKTITGRLGEMLDLHVGLNHGCKGTSHEDRKIELRTVLEDAYSRKLGDDEHCVVLYMWREGN